MSTSRAAVLAPLTLAMVCGCSGSHAPASAGPVPWARRPLPPYTTPSATFMRYPTSAPPCRGSQLRVSRGRTAVGLSNRLEELVLTNRGTRSCLLRGYPAITAVNAEGVRVPFRPRRGGTYFGRLVPADLEPGGHVFLDFGTADLIDCSGKLAPPVRYRDLVFTLPRGASVRARDISVDEYCSIDMSEFGLPMRYALARARPGTPGTLQARLRLPASVRAGATLRFTVTLANATGRRRVVLDPCPGYTESIGTPRALVRRSFRLNCDSVHEIGAHSFMRYAMRLAVSRKASGLAKVAWSLDTPTGPFTAGAVRIAAA